MYSPFNNYNTTPIYFPEGKGFINKIINLYLYIPSKHIILNYETLFFLKLINTN